MIERSTAARPESPRLLCGDARVGSRRNVAQRVSERFQLSRLVSFGHSVYGSSVLSQSAFEAGCGGLRLFQRLSAEFVIRIRGETRHDTRQRLRHVLTHAVRHRVIPATDAQEIEDAL